jgi:hypothetical protein
MCGWCFQLQLLAGDRKLVSDSGVRNNLVVVGSSGVFNADETIENNI